MLPRAKGLFDLIAGSREASPSGLRPEDRELVRRIRSERLTYLSERRLASVANTCRSLEDGDVPGVFLEAGCALGGSAILLASLKGPGRPLFIYDVFGTIPPPTEKDTHDAHERYGAIAEGRSEGIRGDKYYGYEENVYGIVRANFRNFGIDCERRSVTLVKGLVQDTMRLDRPVAFAHIDVDWYEPVLICLERVFPNLVVGGSMILDDYHDWGGCRKAADDYLRGVAGHFTSDDSAGSMRITKVKG
jgi:hypothetical protein